MKPLKSFIRRMWESISTGEKSPFEITHIAGPNATVKYDSIVIDMRNPNKANVTFRYQGLNIVRGILRTSPDRNFVLTISDLKGQLDIKVE